MKRHPPHRCTRAKLLLGAAAVILAAASAAPAAEQGLALGDPWFRFIIPARPAAGYFTLRNESATPRTLTGAESPACGMLMLHRSVRQGGQERMAMVERMTVPAHGEVRFAPGGYHLMCLSPSKDMSPGSSVPVTLRFADGGTIMADFPVRGATGR